MRGIHKDNSPNCSGWCLLYKIEDKEHITYSSYNFSSLDLSEVYPLDPFTSSVLFFDDDENDRENLESHVFVAPLEFFCSELNKPIGVT